MLSALFLLVGFALGVVAGRRRRVVNRQWIDALNKVEPDSSEECAARRAIYRHLDGRLNRRSS